MLVRSALYSLSAQCHGCQHGSRLKALPHSVDPVAPTYSVGGHVVTSMLASCPHNLCNTTPDA